jgi:hypothetical protein
VSSETPPGSDLHPGPTLDALLAAAEGDALVGAWLEELRDDNVSTDSDVNE